MFWKDYAVEGNLMIYVTFFRSLYENYKIIGLVCYFGIYMRYIIDDY